MPLAQIKTMSHTGDDTGAIQALDADLAGTIERLQRIRAELAVILEHRAPIDTPPPFGPVADRMGERDRALVAVLSRVFDDDSLADLSQLISERDEYDEDFEAIAEDADDVTVEALARRMAVGLAAHRERYPWMKDPAAAAPQGKEFAEAAIAPAVLDLYNKAQLKVLFRAFTLLES